MATTLNTGTSERISTINTSGGLTIGGSRQVRLSNPTPLTNQNMLYREIELKTVDNTNPGGVTYIQESYVITPGNFSPTRLENSGGLKYFLQFGSSKYGLKFHFPSGNNLNKIFVTFVEKDDNYEDGIKDYISAIPSEWITASINYFNSLPTNSGGGNAGNTRDFSVSIFPNFKSKTFWLYFKGTGASSIVNNAQGVVKITFNYTDNSSNSSQVSTGGGSTVTA